MPLPHGLPNFHASVPFPSIFPSRFELLQNAVDEGASAIRLELRPGGAQTGPSLLFTHNGAQFTPLDVNGLASVGMSTKTTKRAVGFMGVGFKACYKR